MTATQLTQGYLKSILHYDPETGVFTRIKQTGPRGTIGAVAGGLRNGYESIQIHGRKHLSHRLAFLYMTGSMPEEEVDHINGIKNDNSWLNLRSVDHSENMRNSAISILSKSGVPGVWWRRDSNKWRVSIISERKRKSVGVFDDFFDAVCARKAAEKALNYHPNHGRSA